MKDTINSVLLLTAVIASRDAHALLGMASHKATLCMFAHHVLEHEYHTICGPGVGALACAIAHLHNATGAILGL